MLMTLMLGEGKGWEADARDACECFLFGVIGGPKP